MIFSELVQNKKPPDYRVVLAYIKRFVSIFTHLLLIVTLGIKSFIVVMT